MEVAAVAVGHSEQDLQRRAPAVPRHIAPHAKAGGAEHSGHVPATKESGWLARGEVPVARVAPSQ